MSEFVVKPLDANNWSDFARLVENHNGVWGGCWCMTFHEEGVGRGRTAAQNRIDKECRHGFQGTRQLGKNHCVVTRVIDDVA